jgi:hypothetical protein
MSSRVCWCLVVLCIAVLVSALLRETGPSPRGKTLARIDYCYFVLDASAEARSNCVHQLLSAQSRGEDLSTALASIIYAVRSGQAIQAVASHAPQPVFRNIDGWNEPLLVSWRTNLLEKASPMLLMEHSLLIIWSKGENRSNEWGYGDDVFRKR